MACGRGEVVVIRTAVPGLTVNVTAVDVLPLRVASPQYEAVKLWGPAASVEMVKVAVPLLSEAVPSEVVPSRKVTVPVAVAGVTVTVMVTVWPAVEGLGETDRD